MVDLLHNAEGGFLALRPKTRYLEYAEATVAPWVSASFYPPQVLASRRA